MHVVHGAWIPHDSDDFVQNGEFYLWVETDTPVRHKRRKQDWNLHPRHLAHDELAAFLAEKLKIVLPWGADINRIEREENFLLPSVEAGPLPSAELQPYMEGDTPEAWELSPWQIYCYPLRHAMAALNDIHFIALHAAEDFQLGADLLFWWQYSQELKKVIAADQYIPSLVYHVGQSVPGRQPRGQSVPGRQPHVGRSRGTLWVDRPARKDEPGFELRAGWEFCSDAYESTLTRYAECMPPACTAGFDRPDGCAHYTPNTLLRHFSECALHSAVVGTPSTAAFDRILSGSLLADCFLPLESIPGSDEALEEYRRWAGWRAGLTAGLRDAGFTLCFRLEEVALAEDESGSVGNEGREPDPRPETGSAGGEGREPEPKPETGSAGGEGRWRVHFLVASKRDPSFRVSLSEYWSLDDAGRKNLIRHLGAGDKSGTADKSGGYFERHLLLALGYAARVYPKVWEGLETDRPAGFSLTLEETYAFLREHAWVLEDAGFILIVPAWWTREGRRRARVRLSTSVSSGAAAGTSRAYFSLDTVIKYQYQLSIDGQPVTEAEWQQLVEAKTPLVRFRGEWMELDRDRIQQMLSLWEEREREQPEMTLQDLMRIAADDEEELEWNHDRGLQDVLDALREKSVPEVLDDPPNFHGSLREYQKRGVAWLRYLERLSLSPCLADDMGLGKTVQVIAQLVAERNESGNPPPTLLIAPTSVLGNWRKEVERFAPHLRVLVHHGPGRHKDAESFRVVCEESDVVVTSFALARLDQKLLRDVGWRRIVVDEAQNIKNPASAQARAIAKLDAPHRLALTGTPVENRLRDLWSIFNFLNPGYLGKEAQFRRAFEIPIERDNDPGRSAALKRLVEPFILRRLKTDPQIIQDLPEKSEQKVYCNLTAEQASLYEAVVRDVERELEDAEGIQRRGLILATLLKLKQLCNHPAQFLHDGSAFTGDRSHKLQRLTEMLDEIVEAQESVLVFTQFTEMGAALEKHIRHTLRCDTHYLHGGTSMAKRERMVSAFQDPETAPSVFILSVRAGGTGLNLTKANHVFHYDRWWNPAVEDQATDRAFRIGQRKNVFVHKFVALGTVEERIDQMIEDKKRVAAAVVGSDESWLTELDNETFKNLIALRRTAVLEAA